MAELPDFENEKTAEGTADGADGPYNAIHSTGFKDFLFKEQINRAIVDVAFEHPSEVQHECIPQATLGTDILCQAKSGMGKTAVFVLTTLQQLDEERPGGAAGPEVLVVCHTRELAVQIEAEYKRFSKYLTAPAQAVFGGIPVDNDRKTLKNRKPRVVVGTPGRLQQLIRDQALDLSSVKHFVLDECDKCLEKADMRNDIQQIFFKTPKKKQVMMFTATMSGEMADLCKKFMQDPHTILVSGDSNLTLQGLLQYRIDIDDSQKNRKLGDLLDKLEFNQIVIFVKSVQRAKALNQLLNECSFPSICIHSQMKQDDRTKLYKQFKDFQKRILVATDLFGRGIDIERVNVVVNYDAPAESDPYLHRVGRAGRFGTKGLAITFVSSEEDKSIMGEIQDRFSVTIEDMPESIDPSAYLNA